MRMKQILPLVLLTSLLASALTVNVDHYDSTWYISRDDTISPPRHYIGLKNFNDVVERNAYFNADIKKTDPNFRVRIDRSWTDENADNIISTPNEKLSLTYAFNGDFNRFNKQFVHYIPNADLTDQRGGFFVLEDAGEEFHYNCEVRYYLQYFQTFQLAKHRYETLKLNNVVFKRLLLSGPTGRVESTDMNFFINKYINKWCSYRFGINIIGDTVQRKRVFLWSDGNNDIVSDNDYEFPVNPNVLDPSYSICNFATTDTYDAFIPSEFYAHCSNKKSFSNWNSETVYYSYCFQINYSEGNPLYYRKGNYCRTEEGKVFVQLHDLNRSPNPLMFEVSFKCSTANFSSLAAIPLDPNSLNFKTYYDDYHTFRVTKTVPSNTFPEFSQSFDNDSGTMTPTYSIVRAYFNSLSCYVFTSTVSTDNLDYLHYELTLDNVDYNPPVDPGTSLTLQFSFRINMRLILPEWDHPVS